MPIKETEREMRSWADHQGWRMQRRGGRLLMYNRRDDDLGKRHSFKTLAEVKAILEADAEPFLASAAADH